MLVVLVRAIDGDDVRVRESRIRPIADGVALSKFGWATRGRKIVASTPAPPPGGSPAGKSAVEAGASRKSGS